MSTAPTAHDIEALRALEEEERSERIRNRVILGGIFILGVIVALVVGAIITGLQVGEDKAQDSATAARGQADQAQAEKFTLAQQVAAACAGGTLDEDVATQLCMDAEQITREGPRGAQGIPGIQGAQGVQGVAGPRGPAGANGKDSTVPGAAGANGAAGADGEPGAAGPEGPQGAEGAAGPEGPQGATGPEGPQGPAGQDGAVGPMGASGKNGQPPASWVVYGESGQEIERCQRTADFDPASPTYSCTRSDPAPTQ